MPPWLKLVMRRIAWRVQRTCARISAVLTWKLSNISCCFSCSSPSMEVLTERLVPNIVLLILVLSFTTVTHGKFKNGNSSSGTKISAASHGLFHLVRETLACRIEVFLWNSMFLLRRTMESSKSFLLFPSPNHYRFSLLVTDSFVGGFIWGAIFCVVVFLLWSCLKSFATCQLNEKGLLSSLTREDEEYKESSSSI